MKKILVLAVTVVCAVIAQAADYPYLVFTNTAGTTTSLSVSNMTLTVNGSELSVTNAEGTQAYTLTDLAAMQFSKDGNLTAIENVLDGEKSVDVYSVTGVGLGSFSNLHEAASVLPTGAYVIKQGGKSQTVVVR
ncbi:MAG: hypothetical protein IKQ50_06695 [Paludibacteraceae bacterium]|nr:hypothetical protein [Paludibacteraceae bacterium]